MIKDRVIQKRIKGKVLAMAMTAVMASFFVTMGVKAGPEEGNLQDITGSGLNTAQDIILKTQYRRGMALG